MAINKNHEFEELNGIKCGIVEKNVKPARVDFLRSILEFNGYTVVAVPSPPAKTAAPASPPTEGAIAEPVPVVPETFTVGVTDYTFNPVNAIFGRLLKTTNNQVVTLAYWRQEEPISNDEIPYFGTKAG